MKNRQWSGVCLGSGSDTLDYSHMIIMYFPFEILTHQARYYTESFTHIIFVY